MFHFDRGNMIIVQPGPWNGEARFLLLQMRESPVSKWEGQYITAACMITLHR